MHRRASGILLHISSLPSEYGIGDLGPGAYAFVDFLEKTKQRYWQILPLNPVDGIFGYSPYSSFSAFAGNPFFISPELLVKEGWLQKEDIVDKPLFTREMVDYEETIDYKNKLFNCLWERCEKILNQNREFEEFCLRESFWLDDFALFAVLKKLYSGRSLLQWPEVIKNRAARALVYIQHQFEPQIIREKLLQYLFFKQWFALKEYCQRKGVYLIGDVPIYVNDDSVEVWTYPELFKLNDELKPEYVAGVPPDYFSETGQRWGNPVYNWEKLKETNFAWWIKRLEHNFRLFDWVRIDHFRGFVAYWEIPAAEETAVKGKWMKASAEHFFTALQKHFKPLPMIAEDLGIITPDVEEARKRFDLPGMKVLLFAFDGDLKTHPYIPENYEDNCIVYTGTHDNNTVKGWFLTEASKGAKENLFKYLGRELTAREIPWTFIEAAFRSRARTAIIPLQDLLGLGQEARMNIPGTVRGNWRWRFLPSALDEALADRLLKLTESSQR